jgi:pimeloyl-ACP methyl ester carboxylesterase
VSVERGFREYASAAVLAFAGMTAGIDAQAAGIADVIDALDPHPCYSGDLTCVTIAVPLDHDRPGDNRQLDIEFAIHLATGDYRGTLLYFVGGPGQAGVPFGTVALTWFDPSILEHFDIVFFDQRGTGPRHGVDCRGAATAHWQLPWRPDDIDVMVDDAERFTADCVAESGRADILPYIGTAQAARDVDIFRQAIGAPKLWVYGVSYGSYIAQFYAANHPEAVSALILDGVMDTSLDEISDGRMAAAAGEDIVSRMEAACLADESCRYAFPSSPTKAYDRLMAKLETAPIAVNYPLSNGSIEPRELTANMLFGVLSNTVYGPFYRTAFLHALASAQYGDFVPLARIGFQVLEIDADTLAPIPVSSAPYDIYWGAFTGISCRDYVPSASDPWAASHAAFAEAVANRNLFPHFYGFSVGVAAQCPFWPGLADRVEPLVFRGGDYPVLILTSDADGATPISQAKAVYERIPDASMIIVRNGPHGSFGQFNDCVDNAVAAWLVSGQAPKPGIRFCDDTLLDSRYWVDAVALYTRTDAGGIAWASIYSAISAILTTGWEAVDPLTVGCTHGGSLIMNDASLTDLQILVQEYWLSQCQIWPGFEMTGSLELRDTPSEWHWTLDIRFGGDHRGRLLYRYDLLSDTEEIDGDLDGVPFVLPQ